jgi:hypothetical protein|nr:MAG TPA: hypothetical protein [Caudoviricetes sp.]
MKITITDRTDFVPGLENDGGCYIYYTVLERVSGEWYRNSFTSCDFEEPQNPWKISGDEVKRLVELAKNDSNCRVKFSR